MRMSEDFDEEDEIQRVRKEEKKRLGNSLRGCIADEKEIVGVLEGTFLVPP
jgi:hypothetical protein